MIPDSVVSVQLMSKKLVNLFINIIKLYYTNNECYVYVNIKAKTHITNF